MVERPDHPPGGPDPVEIALGLDYSFDFAAVRQDFTPGRDNEGMAESPPAAGMLAGLSRGDDEAAGLDSAGAEQHVPMGLAGRDSEGGRHHEDRGAGPGKRRVQGREAQIVADAEADGTESRFDHDRALA